MFVTGKDLDEWSKRKTYEGKVVLNVSIDFESAVSSLVSEVTDFVSVVETSAYPNATSKPPRVKGGFVF